MASRVCPESRSGPRAARRTYAATARFARASRGRILSPIGARKRARCVVLPRTEDRQGILDRHGALGGPSQSSTPGVPVEVLGDGEEGGADHEGILPSADRRRRDLRSWCSGFLKTRHDHAHSGHGVSRRKPFLRRPVPPFPALPPIHPKPATRYRTVSLGFPGGGADRAVPFPVAFDGSPRGIGQGSGVAGGATILSDPLVEHRSRGSRPRAPPVRSPRRCGPLPYQG